MNSFSIKLPDSGITRYYMLSFISLIDYDNISSLNIVDGKINIVSKSALVSELFADIFSKVSRNLRNYLEVSEKKHVEVPASGNDKKIFDKLRSDMNLPSDSSFVEIFEAYAEHLKKVGDAEFNTEMNDEGVYSSPSIFRPELYSLTRGPFFNGRLGSENVRYETDKHPIGAFLVRLGGYVISRAGFTITREMGNIKYLTVLVLPLSTEFTRWNFESLINRLRGEKLPGLSPEEGIIMWLALQLPDIEYDLLVVGMENPSGQVPAKIKIGLHAPLREYRFRAERFLSKIRQLGMEEDLKRLICDASIDNESTVPTNLLHLLFLASQGDRNATDELLLRASKIWVTSSEEDRQKAHVKFSKRVLYILSPLCP
ncbi:MAG: hypothetical protein QXM93_06525 [Candidatus Methanomethyliaceae archaeon]